MPSLFAVLGQTPKEMALEDDEEDISHALVEGKWLSMKIYRNIIIKYSIYVCTLATSIATMSMLMFSTTIRHFLLAYTSAQYPIEVT